MIQFLDMADLLTLSLPNRKKLPYSSNERGPVSLWTILKHSIGKDLSRITMPVDVNEPLSFLQRCSEYTEQAELLTLAGQADDPVDRMKVSHVFFFILFYFI